MGMQLYISVHKGRKALFMLCIAALVIKSSLLHVKASCKADACIDIKVFLVTPVLL